MCWNLLLSCMLCIRYPADRSTPIFIFINSSIGDATATNLARKIWQDPARYQPCYVRAFTPNGLFLADFLLSQLAQRLYGLVRITRNMLEFQKEVVELVNIPNFQGEHTKLKTYATLSLALCLKQVNLTIFFNIRKLSTFKELRVANMLFSYKDHDAPALDFYGTLVISFLLLVPYVLFITAKTIFPLTNCPLWTW